MPGVAKLTNPSSSAVARVALAARTAKVFALRPSCSLAIAAASMLFVAAREVSGITVSGRREQPLFGQITTPQHCSPFSLRKAGGRFARFFRGIGPPGRVCTTTCNS